jgi:hypothetical protein
MGVLIFMTHSDITRLRLIHQQIAASRFQTPGQLAYWLGGMQAQEYPSLKWAFGIRLPGMTDASVEQAFADKQIIRSWPLRNTLHVVAAQDLRWMLDLTGPRMLAALKGRHRELGLDEFTMKHSQEIMTRAMEGGKQLSRKELTEVLEQNGIEINGMRLSHIIYQAGIGQLICFGPKRGVDFTYTLLDEWSPGGLRLDQETAVSELAKRYFLSHGPATLQDFVWWSGLTITQARSGLESVRPMLQEVAVDGQIYWMSREADPSPSATSSVYLLPGFDEFIIAYKDRSASVNNDHTKHVVHSNGIFNPVILIDGRVAGTWRGSVKNKKLVLVWNPFRAFSGKEQEGIEQELERYKRFLNLSA